LYTSDLQEKIQNTERPGEGSKQKRSEWNMKNMDGTIQYLRIGEVMSCKD
jgi:hypothetical protein